MSSTATESTAPPVADLPSGDPIPSSSAPAAAAPSAPPKPLPLRALLAATPAQLDAFLARLQKCLSTPPGIDTVLLFVCYTSRLGASVLAHLSRSALRRSAKEWVALVASLPPRTTILFTPSSAPAAPPSAGTAGLAAAALVLSQRLKALSVLLSEARMILRLWSLLGMYFWGRGLVLKAVRAWRARRAPPRVSDEPAAVAEPEMKETFADTAVAWTQFLACVTLQALENGAYLSSKGVLEWTPAQQAKAYKWSSRFWALYTGVEIGRLAGEALAKRNTSAKGKEISEKGEGNRTEAWRRQFARNLAWAPLTVHWGMDKGFVSEPVVGMLGSIPGIIQMRQLWKESAPAA